MRKLGRLPGLACLVCTAWFVMPAATAQVTPADPTADARTWLARMRAAATGGNFQGTMVVSSGGTSSSSRIWHFNVGDQVYERLEALDGRQQQVVRHNDDLHTIWPQSRTVVIERRGTVSEVSTTPQEIDPQALEHYELKREGESRVAGRPAAVMLLEPRDALRYAQRLWADIASGLMLRADVLGRGGSRPVLESSAYSDIEIGVRPQPERVLAATRQLQGYRVLRPQQRRTTLEAEGWTLARPVAGFRLAGCVQRGMISSGDDVAVVQAVFSDGLTHVSLFIEPYRSQQPPPEAAPTQGATATFAMRQADAWITAMGDVPPATLRLFTDAVERRRP